MKARASSYPSAPVTASARALFLSLLGAAATSAASTDARIDFKRDIAPLFDRACVSCHGREKEKSGLRLDDRRLALRGGDEGPAIVAGKSSESLLIQLVVGEDPERLMPPKGEKLSEAEINLLRTWIDQGAKWPDSESASNGASTDHWSLLPPFRHPAPAVHDPEWGENPIDAFVLSRLTERTLTPSLPADRATLIRRMSFDITGLPPSPEETSNFVNDSSPHAVRRLVDRLLDSPRYGERWARHWLDIARFSESQGFERDKIKPHAWRYRDYVIRSFNDDKPYDQFVREQIAGDVLPGRTSDRIIATGFLVAGAYDEVGLNQQSKIMRARTREEALEDIVGTVGQTFLGLTVNCGRCHSHKSDPISQEDYYRLKAVFEGVNAGDRDIHTPEQITARNAEKSGLQQRLTRLQDERRKLENIARKRALARADRPWATRLPQPVEQWDFERSADSLGGVRGALKDGARIENGRLVLSGKGAHVQTSALNQTLTTRTLEAWTTVTDLNSRGGGVITVERNDKTAFDSIVYGERKPRQWIAGSNSFRRTRDLVGSPDESAGNDQLIHMAITYAKDGTISIYRNGKPYGEPYKPTGPESDLKTYPAGEFFLLFGKRHTTGGRPFFHGEIEEARVFNRALSAQEIEFSFQAGPDAVPPEEITNALTAEERQKRSHLDEEIKAAKGSLAKATERLLVFAAVPRQPGPTHRLARGDAAKPREVIAPGALAVIAKPNGSLGLKPDSPEGARRAALAAWIAHADNPLTARVIVNRVWQWHFGKGIVDTPNDFGAMGGAPTHPKLLDRLAIDFMANGWSLKWLHKQILLSKTYQQSSAHNPTASEIDADNRLLWRFSPRRLEAEAVRDSLLSLSGQIDFRMGGPGYMPWNLRIDNTHFYTWEDKIGADFNRRTVYRLGVLSARDSLLDALDCPDLSTRTPTRASTTTPIQALALMNNSFVQRQVRHFADRLQAAYPDDHAKQIEHAYLLAYSRKPSASETERAQTATRSHGLTALCWAILNSNELVYLR